jgi:EAL domain-containing protein (putative c-di-GMP-specific phosphodiesterase class I)
MLIALAEPFPLGKDAVYISASIGITIFPSDTDNIESLLRNADQAMYAAKEQGRNRFSYFTASMQATAQRRLQLSNDLRGAIAAGQFEVYLQPIVELATGRIYKAEALLRWRHPLHGMVEPSHFIPIAEETGLINEIGDWVFRESARLAKLWYDASPAEDLGRDGVQISVNKSPRQFFTGNTHKTWIEHLTKIGLPTTCIAIEITEGLLLDDRPEVAEKLTQFRNAGFGISLDDFGTGYSAMAYLKKFPIDFLKIDQSFVRDMATDHGDQAIVEAIIVMAHKLGLKVIAEGVETVAQRDMLNAAGCDYGQGYLFAKPMSTVNMPFPVIAPGKPA